MAGSTIKTMKDIHDFPSAQIQMLAFPLASPQNGHTTFAAFWVSFTWYPLLQFSKNSISSIFATSKIVNWATGSDSVHFLFSYHLTFLEISPYKTEKA